MAILGIERLIYGVDDLEMAGRFFDDFGLVREFSMEDSITYQLPEGSRVVIYPLGHPSLPKNSLVTGFGVQEVIWGVDSDESLHALEDVLSSELDLLHSDDGIVRFVPEFGVPMGLKKFAKKPVICAPDPSNAPGHIRRLNQPRKWRRRARPKVISHVVFASPGYATDYRFMIEKLGFRLSDSQRTFGVYLRADGANNHHHFLFLNSHAPFPGMDGKVRFHHANFGVEDLDEIMVGANHMLRQGWEASDLGLGRHRVDSALFYYLPCPAGGDAEYGADGDYIDDSWVPRDWEVPLFGYASHVHNLPEFLMKEPEWRVHYLNDDKIDEAKS